LSANFCTLFNINFASNGLALFESLRENEPDSRLFVLCMDVETYDFLKSLNLESLVPVSLSDFLFPELEEKRKERSVAEFCWTCTSHFLRYCIETFELDHCCYLDADLFFFRELKGYAEMRKKFSVLITEHNFAPAYDDSGRYGRYCVQFIYFDVSKNAKMLLKKWCQQCLEWCYDRVEENRYGDQKYLDSWPEEHDFVGVVKDTNYGVGPWNLTRFRDASPVFVHFHNVKFFEGKFDIRKACLYEIPLKTMWRLYVPYIRGLASTIKQNPVLRHNHHRKSPNWVEFFLGYYLMIFIRRTRYWTRKAIRKLKRTFFKRKNG